MRVWTKTPQNGQEIAILLFPRFSNHCLANAVEPLRAANELLDREFYKWRFVTLDGCEVKSSSGLPVLPSSKLRDHSGGDVLFVLASYDAPKLATTTARRALSAASHRFDRVIGMDTGAWLLADAGLLDNRAATIHPAEATAFAERFENVDLVSDRFVFDGPTATCGGAMTSFDLVLEMLRQTHGEATKLEVATYFLEKATQPDHQVPHRHLKSPVLASCLALMAEHIEVPCSIFDLASKVGVSQKTLSRMFLKELGTQPNTVYRRIRLLRARDLLRQTGHSIGEVSLRCGYQDSTAMTRAFVAEFGVPPSQYRQSAVSNNSLPLH